MTLQERIKQLRARVDKRLKEEQPVPVGREPRYDAVFFEGVAWLDSLAGPPEPEDPWAYLIGETVPLCGAADGYYAELEAIMGDTCPLYLSVCEVPK